MENLFRSQRTLLLYKIKVKNCKLIDLVIRFEFSSNFKGRILKFSDKLNHPFLFGNMFPQGHGFVAMPVTSCIKDT